ncbi:hypothetical protein SAMN05444000_11012 [Shimia gijangensis]|uniref:Outer membrane protein beta-barrel domain-containing protein n=1 Tax=Shimia gijangensis TaxID=1470563 RepID=A0A1M6K6E6_9RHOB|nr:hypothetical protein [Shimia gijangensis]SHJ54477.1 hypothetical protein SAMN05444000_11012 [Shimia gijangensis]
MKQLFFGEIGMENFSFKSTKKSCLIAIALFGFISTSAHAEQAAFTFSDDWTFDLSVYAFLPGSLSGSSTIAGQKVPLDLDLSDALDLLNFAFAGRFEAWNGDLGFIADLNYLALEINAQPAPPITADVDVEQAWLGLLGGYRVASGTNGRGNAYSIDLQGGARYNSLKQTVAITGGPGAGTTLGGTETWWEPVIGARALWQINDRWNGFAAADAGGFGAGENDLAWSATLGLGYEVGKHGALKFGLRYYSIDYSTVRSDGVFAYKVQQIGPFVGYTYTF